MRWIGAVEDAALVEPLAQGQLFDVERRANRDRVPLHERVGGMRVEVHVIVVDVADPGALRLVCSDVRSLDEGRTADDAPPEPLRAAWLVPVRPGEMRRTASEEAA